MNRLNQKGQTMIEIVFTLGIVIIGLVGVLGVIMSNIAGGDISKSQIIASNLAREGVEVVRQIRDANWLSSSRDWDEDLVDDDYYQAIAVFGYSGNWWDSVWALVFNPQPDDTIVYLNTQTGIYLQDINQPASPFQATPFRREIMLNEICSNADDDYRAEEVQVDGQRCSANPVYPDKIGIKVESKVIWSDRGKDHEIIAEERIYNWR